MATTEQLAGFHSADKGEHAAAIGGIRFDWAVIGASTWLIGGVFLDGWAHNHGRVDSSFFTPWHAILYSGFLATALVLIGGMLINRTRGYSFARALPSGYELSLLGVILFSFAGAGDLVWHTLFGIEKNVEALFSPTHLLLAAGAVLIVSGPLRAFWQRTARKVGNLFHGLPMLLSVTFTVSFLTFITQYLNPFTRTYLLTDRYPGDPNLSITAAMSGILVTFGLLTGVILLLIRRWSLPLGSISLILGINAALMATQQDEYAMIPAALIGGLVIDLMIQGLRPSAQRKNYFRLVAALVPALLTAVYFATSALSGGGLWWSVHVWTGAIFVAGVAGLLLSFLILPPPLPAD